MCGFEEEDEESGREDRWRRAVEKLRTRNLEQATGSTERGMSQEELHQIVHQLRRIGDAVWVIAILTILAWIVLIYIGVAYL